MRVGTKSLLFGVHQFLWHPVKRREVVRPRTDFQITQTWADAMRKMTTKRRRGPKWRRWRNARERVRLHYHRVPVEKIDG